MKCEKKWVHLAFNAVFFILTCIFFGVFISRKMECVDAIDVRISVVVVIFAAVVLVNAIKALRLYIIIFGNSFDSKKYLHEYIKTALINSLLPFKSGEIYRGYSIGSMVGSVTNGYVMVIFDRFMDTFALISVVLVLALVSNVELTGVYIILAAFLVIVILVYMLFEPLYQYWNHFLIYYKSSQHTLAGLQFLKVCEDTFTNINSIVKGRFIMLYLLSLCAWGLEIGLLTYAGNILEQFEISRYLSDILTGNLNVYNVLYTALCLILFVLLEIVLFICRLLKERKE